MLLRHFVIVALVAPLAAPGLAPSMAASPVSMAAQAALTPEQRVAALKQSLQDSQASLRRYEWIETTIISLKGEEKARKQQRCSYGPDGKVQKVAMAEAPKSEPAPSKGGRGGRVKKTVVENKKDDMKDYMERAAALIQQYVPPAPPAIQKVKDAGKLTIKPADQGRVRVELLDYVLPGDRMTIDINGATNSLAAVTVASYLDKKDDVVALDVKFASLADGTGYTSQTTLDAKAKNIRVVIQNTGHHVIGQ
jgi:hypothetical protein